MKPYKIHNTWVDLDSVMAVDDQPFCVHRLLTDISDVQGAVTLVFRDKPLFVCLDELSENGDPYWPKKPTQKAIQTWEAFKTAWMNKDKPDLDEFSSNADMPQPHENHPTF